MCRSIGDTAIPGARLDDPELVHVQSYDSYVTDFARFVETVVSPREEHRIVFAHSGRCHCDSCIGAIPGNVRGGNSLSTDVRHADGKISAYCGEASWRGAAV